MYIGEKSVVYIRFVTICAFRHPLGPWNVSPAEKGDYCNTI